MSLRDYVVDCDLVPDRVARAGVRRVLRQRLREEDEGDEERQKARLTRFVAELRESPIAMRADAANAQHYEVPARFFELVLGPRMKYSCSLWTNAQTLEDAENEMLALTVERARLADGQQILELGCGWGSLTLYVAERFPGARIVAVSNSASQREFIEERAGCRGLMNIRVTTADMNDFAPGAGERFDRVVSVEMFEHMRNYARLLARIADWLVPDGRLFVHVFCHRRFAYPYEVRGASDWMAQYFFSGGTMPSDELFDHFQDDLAVERRWRFSGTHYQKTAEAWLANLDRHRAEVDQVLAEIYGDARRWRARWRLFFMACAELFGYRDGEEWGVSHYAMTKTGR